MTDAKIIGRSIDPFGSEAQHCLQQQQSTTTFHVARDYLPASRKSQYARINGYNRATKATYVALFLAQGLLEIFEIDSMNARNNLKHHTHFHTNKNTKIKNSRNATQLLMQHFLHITSLYSQHISLKVI